ERPSRAQRDLPYPAFDLDRGVRHMQLYGVRYYMAFSETALAAAREHPDLTEVATSGPWVVFEVADAPVVEPLEFEPVVWTDVGPGQDEWMPAAIDVFLDPDRWDALPAAGGPDGWARIAEGDPVTPTPVEPAQVSDVEVEDDRIA